MQISIEGSEAWEQIVDIPGIWVLHNYGSDQAPLSCRPNGLCTGMNGGYQAINLAYLLGCTRIVLLGYELADGSAQTHWFGDHPIKTNPGLFPHMRRHFEQLAPVLRKKGVAVWNASANTALKCFPRMSLDEVQRESMVTDPARAGVPA